MSVVVLGSINRDIICRVSRLPRAGETVEAFRTQVLPGGKGANQAVAAARMGAKVAMIGCVGDDEGGAAMLAFLAEAGVGTAGITRLPGTATGTAYISAARDGENQIVVDPAANANLSAETLGPLPGDLRVLLAQLETPVAATADAFARAGAAGAVRILNTAPARADAAALFPLADLIILNQTEAAHYLDVAEPPAAVEDAAAVARLLSRPDQRAIVTLGADGAVLVGQQGLHHAPGIRVSVVDTTGAGDCFCGALAALLADGMDAVSALPLANVAAALCVGAEGAAPAMPERAAVMAAAQRNGRDRSRSWAGEP